MKNDSTLLIISFFSDREKTIVSLVEEMKTKSIEKMRRNKKTHSSYNQRKKEKKKDIF
jgi:hypothetical protein